MNLGAVSQFLTRSRLDFFEQLLGLGVFLLLELLDSLFVGF